MYTSAVALLRQPAVRRRLRSELAALPQQLVSYEELLAFFIDYGSKEATQLHTVLGQASYQVADIWTASRLATELLPQLAPDSPTLRYAAAAAAICVLPESHAAAAAACTRYLTMLPAALDVARQQGCDYSIASCGYHMAAEIGKWVAESTVRPGLPPPSAVLGWLQQAEAAHRRCKALLPKQWLCELDSMKALAAPAKPSLQRLQQQGDRWRRLTPAAEQELSAALIGYRDSIKDPALRAKTSSCSGCGKWTPQLRSCGACREARYCR